MWIMALPLEILRFVGSVQMADPRTWRPILFSCPNTGDRVQGLLPGVTPESAADDLHPISCVACDGVHFVNLRTGAIIGSRHD